jgi:hypothetical protein
MPARSETLRGTTIGDEMTKRGSFMIMSLGLGGMALLTFLSGKGVTFLSGANTATIHNGYYQTLNQLLTNHTSSVR